MDRSANHVSHHRGDHVTDEALAARVVARDADALGTLYDRYAPAIYAMAAHALGAAEAEEVVQEAFLRLWQRASQFDSSRGRFGAWFMSIARHRVLDELRRRGEAARMRAADSAVRSLAERVDATVDVEHDAWLREETTALRRALLTLPEEQQRVLLLAYFGGLSQSTMARMLGWPLGTVKKRIRLGLQKLRAALHAGSDPRDGDAPLAAAPAALPATLARLGSRGG